MNPSRSTFSSLVLGLLVVASHGCGSSSSTDEQDGGTGGVAASSGGGGSAGSATGGGAGAGGVTNGSGGSAGQSNVACTGGTVEFHLTAANGSAYCAYPSCGMPGVGANAWVSVKNATGQPLPLAGPCAMTCDCLFHQCTCPAPQRLGMQTISWDGTYLQQATCGNGGGVAIGCYNNQCATPGKYTATLCAYPAPADAGANTCPVVVGAAVASCVDVPFDYPSATPVEATIGMP